MKIISLYSGSKGNSTLISAGGANILIDAGKSALKLKQALCEAGLSPCDIDAIFITHEHSDHVSALEVLLKKHHIPVHITDGAAEKLINYDIPYLTQNLKLHTPLFTVQVKGLTVTSFVTPHDSRSSVGYRISFEENGKKREIGFATDVGYVTPDILSGLSGCESVIIEANHDVDMLKNGSYPYELKKRILGKRGHLCNSDCALLAAKLASCGAKNILLAHISEENNTPEIAFDEVAAAIGDDRINLATADQYELTRLVDEKESVC